MLNLTDIHDAHHAAQRMVRHLRGAERLAAVLSEATGLAGVLDELQRQVAAARAARDAILGEHAELADRSTQLRTELADMEPRAAKAAEALAAAERRLADLRARLG